MSPGLVLPRSSHPHDSTRNPLLDLDYGTDDEDMQEVAERLSHKGPVPDREDNSPSQHTLSPSPPPPCASVSDAPIASRKRDRAGSVHEELSTTAKSANSQAQSTESSAGKLFGWAKVRSVLGSSKRQKVDFPGKLYCYPSCGKSLS